MINSRDTHISLNGKKAMQGNAFVTSAGNSLKYPGDPTAPASEVINCHCVLVPDVLLPGERLDEEGNTVEAVSGYDVEFKIGRSVGAKARNYDIVDKTTGKVYHFIEGSKIQNAQTFAGYGGQKPLEAATVEGLCREFGGNPSNWSHRKGEGYLDIDGEEVKAEVHWFQEETVGKVKFKVKK